MADTLAKVQALVAAGDLLFSAHGYDELAADDIFVGELLADIGTAILVEDYPDFAKGPCVLVLQRDLSGRPVHVVWGHSKRFDSPRCARDGISARSLEMVARLCEAEQTMKRTIIKLVHEGAYAVEVPVQLVEEEGSPYLSAQDATKLDEVRRALRQGDVSAAARHGQVYKLTPLST